MNYNEELGNPIGKPLNNRDHHIKPQKNNSAPDDSVRSSVNDPLKTVSPSIQRGAIDEEAPSSLSEESNQQSQENRAAEDTSKENEVSDNHIDQPIKPPLEVKRTLCSVATPDYEDQEDQVSLADLLVRKELQTPGIFRCAAWKFGLPCIVALLLLFVFSQGLQVSRNLLNLPLALMLISTLILAVLLAYIFYVLAKTVLFIMRLSSSSQLSLDQLRDAHLHADFKVYKVAKDEFLKIFLEDMVKRPPEQQARFIKIKGGYTVNEEAQRLLNSIDDITARDWVTDFRNSIQKPMEDMANERIGHYARMVAVKTAISPWPLVDIAAVGYNAILMLDDLTCIFNRRFSRTDTIRILADVFLALYISGRMQDALDAMQDVVEGNGISGIGGGVAAEDEAQLIFETVFENMGNAFMAFAKIGAKKAAEGAANWLLMKRIGRRCVAMLKPIV